MTQPSQLENLNLAFREFYARCRNRFGVAAWVEDGHEREFVISVTFFRGEQYCCFEPGCVLGICDAGWWEDFRTMLNKHGLGDSWPVSVEFRVKVEEGALYCWPKPWPHDDEVTYKPSVGYEYVYGPHQEAAGAHQDGEE